MQEKLDSLSKILVATGAINYMAAQIYTVNDQMKFIPDKDGIHKEGIRVKDEVLAQAVIKLSEIMEDLGDLINAHDCISPIDEYITTPAFDIIVQGNDDVDYKPDTGNNTEV